METMPYLNDSEQDTPSNASIGSFGPVGFVVSSERVFTPGNVQRSVESRFEEHQVVGAKPRLEYIAPALDTMTLTVTLHAFFGVDPQAELARLEGICREGEALRLVLGGVNYGHYVLESLQANWRRSDHDGKVLLASATLKLKEYQ